MAEVDYGDPCAAWRTLRDAYYDLLAGKRVEITEFQAGSGARRRLQFTTVNAKFIEAEIARLQILCERQTGVRSPRTCLRGG
jgi:hypothetical protein